MQDAIDPIDKTRLVTLEQTWTQALADLQDLPCENDEQARWWQERLAYVQGHIMDLEDERQFLVRPLIDDKTRIDKLYKAAGKPAEAVKELIKVKREKYAESILALQAEAQKTAQLAAQNGDSEACASALASIPADLSGVTWSWEVETVDTALLPREYWVVDYAKLQSIATDARKSEQAPVVPGVVFKRAASVSARRGKK